MTSETSTQVFRTLAIAASLAMTTQGAHSQVTLADQPVFTSVAVPGNVALALSVEFPTAISVAYSNRTYSQANLHRLLRPEQVLRLPIHKWDGRDASGFLHTGHQRRQLFLSRRQSQ